MNVDNSVDWQKVREEFPLMGNYTYLNTASSGAISKSTAKVVADFYQDQLQHATINRNNWLDAIKSAREVAANLLGTSSANVGFTTDVSAGINFVADRVAQHKRIVLIKGDFPSVNIPWITKGHSIDWVEKDQDQCISLSEIDKALGAGNKVLAISWVQYSSGFTIDLKELSKICHRKNSLLIVDGTQAVGSLPINLEDLQIDALLASSFKWQGAGYGICLYYENPNSKFDHPIKMTGWNSLKRFSGELTRENLKENAPAIEAGHAKYASLIALNSALLEMSEIGFNEIFKKNQSLRSMLIRELEEVGVHFHSNIVLENQSSIVCIKASDELAQFLDQAAVKVTRRDDYIRLSLHYYNDEQDITNMVEAIKSFQAS